MKIIAAILISAVVFTACTKKPDIENTKAVKVANEWWVTLDLNGEKDVYGIGHFKMATYNTAANDDSLWVDDFQNGWGFKAKVKADYSQLTFAKSNASNAYYLPATPAKFPITVNITDGKVLPGVGHTKSGNQADSIYMKIEFADDPGTIYEMVGHSRTGFFEDEY